MGQLRAILLLAVSALSYLYVPNAVAGGIFTPATLNPPPDSIGANPANPGFRVQQDLPVGDMMTAILTHDDKVIMNANGSTPTYSATVGVGTQGVSFVVPGIVNGQSVNDFEQTHSDPGVLIGTIQVGAFQGGGLSPLGAYVSSFGTQSAPDFSTPTGSALFYGVNLVAWANQSFTVGTSFSIVDGTSASLPGYQFSTTMLSAGTTGWDQGTPYTGIVTIDSSHTLLIPEPASVVLAGTAGALGTAACCWRRRRRSALTARA
jgi:hypothetical protein